MPEVIHILLSIIGMDDIFSHIFGGGGGGGGGLFSKYIYFLEIFSIKKEF